MRLRNIPRAEGTLQAHNIVIKRPEDQKGCWRQVFGNKQPVQIEIGTGKGRFILNMAKANPDINFVGIERYSSVLLRAVEKYDTDEFKDLQNIRFICIDARRIEEELEGALSDLERRVLYLHLMGTDYRTIARLLDKSPKTVDNAIQRIKAKTEKIIRNEQEKD